MAGQGGEERPQEAATLSTESGGEGVGNKPKGASIRQILRC